MIDQIKDLISKSFPPMFGHTVEYFTGEGEDTQRKFLVFELSSKAFGGVYRKAVHVQPGKTISEYENDLRIGPTVIWRESGFKNYEGSYSKGKPHGTWTFYPDAGGKGGLRKSDSTDWATTRNASVAQAGNYREERMDPRLREDDKKKEWNDKKKTR